MDFRPFRRLYAQSGLLFAKPETISRSCESNQEETNKILSNLKSSLSQTLDYFFPLAGRLAVTKHDGTISFYINCNSAGAEFIHAVADVTVADLLEPTYTPDIIDSFFTLDGIPNYEGISLPLLSIQVTVLTDGIFMAFSLNHSVCDGTSLLHFINSWSQISRGLTHKLHPPIILEPRWLPGKTNFPVHLPFSSFEELMVDKFIPSPELRQKTFHFTPQNIAKLKRKANNASGTTFSSLQVVSAHVWLAVTRARQLNPNENVTYACAINSRDRLDPPLPKGYFGNSVHGGLATAKAGELLEKGLSFGASLINQMVKSCTDNEIQHDWQSWVENPVMPSSVDLLSSTNVAVGGSPKFNIHSNDFGWGAPLVCRYGNNYKSDGMIMADAGPVNGVITIGICLPLEILKALEKDVEFTETVCAVLPPEYSTTKIKPLSKL
ncbi:hypothetical protein C5167_011654 [Papaver somniferum]|uniref:Shikimate O-hydroxycinnamoyltransferase n=1 Tax=Papaver somniferum TaxID=3469 RepID=A0A4Y7K6K9_PAPSO|nr:uncharacterized acetyltransferase At3g50280-like [Papaver somniferum]RZC67962.1 hypothetical protein C5167_011654 [Papaver somniferum]